MPGATAIIRPRRQRIAHFDHHLVPLDVHGDIDPAPPRRPLDPVPHPVLPQRLPRQRRHRHPPHRPRPPPCHPPPRPDPPRPHPHVTAHQPTPPPHRPPIRPPHPPRSTTCGDKRGR